MPPEQRTTPSEPREAIRRLRAELSELGLDRTYQSDGRGISVLSVTPEVTVWCKGGVFVWREAKHHCRHPVVDVSGAARRIARQCGVESGSAPEEGATQRESPEPAAGQDARERDVAARSSALDEAP